MATLQDFADEVLNEGLTEHQKFALQLRRLAEFWEQHPELKLPSATRFDIWPDEGEGADKYARIFGSARKDVISDYYFVLRKQFGPLLRVEVTWSREKVCERVVVGTKEVTEKVPVAYEERTVTQEIVEWKCPSVLNGDK